MGPKEASTFSLRSWAAIIGPAGAITVASLAAAWSAVGLLLAGRLRDSVLLALAAFVLDMMDGLVARRFNRASDFGRTFDSLSDLVNYSVWSALAVSVVLVDGVWGWFVGGLVVIGGAIRLARFTVDGFDDGPIKYYRGVVTPHLTLGAMILMIVSQAATVPQWASGAIIAALAVAQLAGFRFRKTGTQWWWASLAIPLAIGAVLWLP